MLSRVVAALSFFTRLPLWRLVRIDASAYKRVVPLWPLAGCVTGGVMAGVLWAAQQAFPVEVSVVLALLSRLLLTGALHEDGLADFCDGFGGGTTRERTLAIMKDSRIGTYGVLGLIIYALLLTATLTSLGQQAGTPRLCALLFCADVFAKWASSHIVNLLPYARNEQTAKNRLVYERMTVAEQCIGLVIGLLPSLLLLPVHLWWVMGPSLAAALLMMLAAWRRLRGYTGDCCGATVLISELTFLLAALALRTQA